MTENHIFAPYALVAIHVVALLWFAIKRGPGPLLAVNLVDAGVVSLGFYFQSWMLTDMPPDWRAVAIVAFECASIVAAVAAWRHVRFALWYSYFAFAVHCVASVVVADFALNFRITHLM